MNMKAKAYASLLTTAVISSAVQVPSSEIIIHNESSCSLSIGYLQDYISKLTLPDEIAPHSTQSGHIHFSSNMFSSNQQDSIGQYITNCNGHLGVISLNFFIGNDHIEDMNYFLNITSHNTPNILILPFGKTIVTNTLPVVIHFLDKETFHDEPKDDTIDGDRNNKPADPSTSKTDRYAESSQPL